jgi:hypothetical protein
MNEQGREMISDKQLDEIIELNKLLSCESPIADYTLEAIEELLSARRKIDLLKEDVGRAFNFIWGIEILLDSRSALEKLAEIREEHQQVMKEVE